MTYTAQSTVATPSLVVNDNNGLAEVDVSNAAPDATVNLYSSSGQEVSSTTADSYGNASFDNLPSGSYYVVQIYDGQQSAPSNTVTFSDQSTLATPSLAVMDTNGVEDLAVSNATPDATVNLFTSSGQVVSATTADSNGNASFDNLSSGSYYVVQTYDGQQSAQSNTVTFSDQSTLATPSLAVMDTNGVEDLAVSNATPDATVNLYSSSGQDMGSTAVDSNGNASFDNLPSGSYYVVQTYDGQQSAQSNTVTFTA
ncbi:hypothetical protein MM817_03121 [Acidibacillus sp. S0AB]|uniref:SD-repeat containing protein B domain-containing protein n=1 Tax=Sulfoacidibacillus ferrooxidans TaxID=2005001 RepID=A0A9X2ADE5_9BACL|nr:hypothetical protein [Sulfoacidibacillus ferrooxidans]